MIRWFVNNPVAVNIMMAAVIMFGVYKVMTITREFFPEADLDRVVVRTIYPGATPSDVEKGVIQKIENAIESVQGIDEIVSQAFENTGVVIVKIDSDFDPDEAADEIKDEVDTIQDFPEDVEEPIISVLEEEIPAISLVVYGRASERRLKRAAEEIKDDLLASDSISRVEIAGIRQEEISVEVQPELLDAYQLTFQDVGRAVSQNNIDVAGGEIQSDAGNIIVRTLGENTDGLALEDIYVRSDPDGKAVRLTDVASVKDTFEDTALRGLFQSTEGEGAGSGEAHRAIQVVAFKRGEEDAIAISDYVKEYIRENRSRFASDALQLGYRVDLARLIYERIELMTRNASQGLILVFLALTVFLNLRLAFWVGSGLVVAFLGTFILMDFMNATINMISLFGLIIVIGLIVDDAIVVAENIYGHMEEGLPKHIAAVKGAEEVARPVMATVMTTVVAFAPLAFMQGVVGDFLSVIPVVVIAALVFSVVECFTMLPSHLAEYGGQATRHSREVKKGGFFSRISAAYNHYKYVILEEKLVDYYEKLLRLSVSWRYVTVGIAFFVCLFTIALTIAGMLPFVLFQRMDSETLIAELEMTAGTPAEKTEEALQEIVRTGLQFPEVKTVYSVVGFKEESENPVLPNPEVIGEVVMEIVPAAERDRSSQQMIKAWREKVGNIPGAVVLKFRERSGGPGGPEIAIRVRSDDSQTLEEAVRYVRDQLNNYAGVRDIEDDGGAGKLEMRVRMKENAYALGLTENDIAQQVRGAFFGYEAQVLQRNDEELKVWVRLDETHRRQMTDLLDLRIKTPSGARAPLQEVASIEMERGIPIIKRVDGKRTTTVQADVDYAIANTNEVTESLTKDLANIGDQFPGVSISFEGAKKETAESIGSLRFGFPVSLILIYCVLAVLFKSYVQPLMVMTIIPFAIIGAMIGHLLFGLVPGRDSLPITFLSLIGMVGLCGIVVNDSLIFINFINVARRQMKMSLFDAIITAGRRRLRPILLTSITTVFGLAPLMLETSFQAQFLIPMAVSISFGLALATVLTLLLLPCFYMVLEDIRTIVYWLFTGRWRVVEIGEDQYIEDQDEIPAIP